MAKLLNTTAGVIQLLAADPTGKPVSLIPGVVQEVDDEVLKHPTVKGYLKSGVLKQGSAASKGANVEATAASAGLIERSNPAEVAQRENTAIATGEQTSVGNPDPKDPVASPQDKYPKPRK